MVSCMDSFYAVRSVARMNVRGEQRSTPAEGSTKKSRQKSSAAVICPILDFTHRIEHQSSGVGAPAFFHPERRAIR